MQLESVLVMSSYSSLFLRKVTVFAFPPAFILCTIHGILSSIAVPALGLIPLFASSLLGTFLMYRDKIAFSGSPVSLTRAQVCLCDLFIGAALLFFLVLSWICKSYDEGIVMLGTYATVPLMANCGIHFYFFVANAVCFLEFHQGCANCRQSTHAQERTPLSSAQSYSDDVESQV